MKKETVRVLGSEVRVGDLSSKGGKKLEQKRHCVICGAVEGQPHNDENPEYHNKQVTLYLIEEDGEKLLVCMLCRDGLM